MRGVIVSLLLALTACATATPAADEQWAKPDARPGDLAVDLYVCTQWSRTPGTPDGVHLPYLNSCMEGRGWHRATAAPQAQATAR